MNRKARRTGKPHPQGNASAEALYARAVAFDRESRFEEAADAFAATVGNNPASVEALCGLASVLAKLGRREDAVEACRKALALRPGFPELRNNLAFLLQALGRAEEAAEQCRQAIAFNPKLPESHYNLGNALRDLGRFDEALAAYHEAAVLRPDNAEAHIAAGNILQLRGRTEEADALFHHAYRLRPLSRRAAAKRTPDFSALLITVPGIANTPSDYLLTGAPYDSYLLALMEGLDYDLAALRRCSDVVVNLVSDADWSRPIQPRLIALIEGLDRPTLNHPHKIASTSRDRIAARLAGIPGCRIPKTTRALGLTVEQLPEALAPFTYPLLLRVAGSHGGEDFEKVDDIAAAARFVAKRPGADYYITEYVPYRSPDGYFRKYRFFVVDAQIFPYHLAIGSSWKVHHFRTDMANQEGMRREEEAFLTEPSRVFTPRHWEALHAIREAVGLEYCGIDCALDADGRIVVFEVNATMLVHGEAGIFAYKEPFVARIKQAFDAMLAKAARRM